MEPRGQQLLGVKFGEFIRLTDEQLTPLLRRFGFVSGPAEGHNRYCKRLYLNGARSIEVYHEILENFTSISLNGPDHRSSDLKFVCRWLGRSRARDITDSRQPFSEHLENYIRLINDHLSDVLSGTTLYHFSDADFAALLASAHSKGEEFRQELKKLLPGLGFVLRTESDREVHLYRQRPNGSARINLSIAAGIGGVDVFPNISIRFDQLEELYRKVYAAAHDDKCPFGLDTSSIHTSLYALEGDEFKHLGIGENLAALDAAQQLAADIARLGEPFFSRISSLERFLEFSDQERNKLPGYRPGIFDVQRWLCAACLIGRFDDVPQILARELARLGAIDEYGGSFVESLRSFANALQQRFPQLSLAKH